LRQLWRGAGRGRTAVVERVATKRASTVRTAPRATHMVLELSFCGASWHGRLCIACYFRALLSRAQAEKKNYLSAEAAPRVGLLVGSKGRGKDSTAGDRIGTESGSLAAAQGGHQPSP
jgi:hypothetical protein